MKRLILSALFVLFAFAVNGQTPLYPKEYTVSSLPAASTMKGHIVGVSDSALPGRCDIGGGSFRSPCYSTGTKWVPWGASNRDVLVDDYGAVHNGSTDDQSSIQSTLDAVTAAGGGTVTFTAGKTYLTSVVQVKRGTTVNLNGATIKAKASAFNYAFAVTNSVLNSSRAVASNQKAGTTTLTTGVKDALSITVGSTTGILTGDRIIISGGPFTGSGVEHGPIEFNSVVTVTDATHLAVKTPLKYSYSAMGMAGAAPFVQNLGAESSLNTDVRITNGALTENGTDNTLYFGIGNTERVEIDHIGFLSKGDAVFAFIYCANVKVHHNIGYGPSVNDTTITTSAGFVESQFTDNSFAFDKTASGGNRGDENATVWEVMTRDDIFARNYLYNLDATNAGSVIAFNFTFGAFNNTIAENHAFGVNPSNSHFDLWFARTYENAGNAGSFGGNLFFDNYFIDFMNGIGDAQIGTVITGNTHKNNSVQSFSTFYTGVDDSAIFGVNYTQNIVRGALSPSSSVIRTRSLPVGDVGFAWGNGSPEGVVSAPVGTLYMRRDGGSGTVFYVKEGGGTGNTGWVANAPGGVTSVFGRSGAVAAASGDYTLAQINPTLGSDATGDIYYRNSSGAIARLPIGSAGAVLNISGGIPAWSTSWSIDPDQVFNAQTGTSYTIVSGDNTKFLTLNNASSIAVTLPQATGAFTTGWTIDVGTIGAGTATITPTTSTIDASRVGGSSAATSLAIATGKSVRLVSNGTNWIAYNYQGRF